MTERSWCRACRARRNQIAMCLVLSLAPMNLLAGGLGAQELPAVRQTDEGILLDFQDAPLEIVIGALAELAGLTVVYTGLPNREVTLRSADPVPRSALRPMLEGVAKANGLAIIDENGVTRIVRRDRARTQTPRSNPAPDTSARQPDMRFYVYPLRHARAESLSRALRNVFGLGSPGAGFEAGEELGDFDNDVPLPDFVTTPEDGPDSAGVSNTPVRSDSPTEPPRGQAATLRGAVRLVPHPLTNSLLIRATPGDYEVLRGAIEQLDTRPLQVLIEVVIAEVRRDVRRDLGIQFTVPDQRDTETGALFGGELSSASAGDVALRILDLGAVGADVVLRALASDGNVTIRSRPVVITQNNQEARLMVGTEQPFVQLFRSLPTEAAIRDQVVQYRDVGIELVIRPTINPDGYVTLEIRQEVSNATAETQFGAPVISTREARTQLLVKDGHTAVIGGLIARQTEIDESGIPILKEIPLLGGLFQSSRKRETATELFLLLTPHVLRTDSDMDEATRQLRDGADLMRERIGELRPLLQSSDTTESKGGM